MQVFYVQRNAFWLAGPAFGKDWRVKTQGFHAAPEPEFKAPAIVAEVILFSSWTDRQFSVSECNYLQ
jgi:hypothetical protein